MSKDIRASIDDAFGFEAVLINSALVSAQNRQRLYWVGRRNEDGTYSKVNVEQPADRGILLKDVLDSVVARDLTCNDKPYTLTASYDGACAWNTIERHQRNMVAEPVCLRYERTEEAKRCRKAYEAHEIKHGYNELNELHPRPDGKTNTLTTVLKDNQIMEPVCVAERGRMYCGQPQHYEARTDGKTNTLTSVEKDNRVAEPIRCMPYDLKEVYNKDSGCVARLDMPKCHDILTRVYGENGKCPTVTAHGGGNTEPKVFDFVPNFGYVIEFDDDGKPIKAIGKDGKEITIYEVEDGKITIKGKQYPIKLKDGYYIIRKLTVRECMRLQTVPEWYEFPVSNSQAYKMLGNGWTCEVIAHLIRSCLLRADEIKADYVYMTEPRKETDNGH